MMRIPAFLPARLLVCSCLVLACGRPDLFGDTDFFDTVGDDAGTTTASTGATSRGTGPDPTTAGTSGNPTTGPGTTTTTTGTSGPGTTTSSDTGGCQPGTEGCACYADQTCDFRLTCLSDVCVDASGLCPYSGDGYCNEPYDCPPGTDVDCCATVQNGVCEERSYGGRCPDGTDYWDCGYCPFGFDEYCSEPYDCPPGSDPDCCATPNNGICEEADNGGRCEPGTDYWDCGECPWSGDGWCHEPNDCPPDSDIDCCGTPMNGLCDETSQGGMCPYGTDIWDCAYCPYSGDGYCDSPFPCAPGTDADCCTTPKNDICEQSDFCWDEQDYWDCGYCPFQGNGRCDEPEAWAYCPDGTDPDDCP